MRVINMSVFFERCIIEIENTLYSTDNKSHENRLDMMEKFLFDTDFQEIILNKNSIPALPSQMTAAILASFYKKYIQVKGLN